MTNTSMQPPKLSLRNRLRRIIRGVRKPITPERRGTVQVKLRDACRPEFSYYLLVVLSSIIATLGLLVDSPAIIIGAMLVAPLMSPIIGVGLASIAGDDRLLRDSVVGLFLGALVAVITSVTITWFNIQLPFISIQEIPGEVLIRTRPGPIDLGVALAGGSAAAFALAMPNISAALPGVAIATALMPPLSAIGVGLAMGRLDVDLVEWDSVSDGEILYLDFVVRTLLPLRHEDSVALQLAIADRLQRPVAVVVNQIFASALDPLVPPTHTPTFTPTYAPTPGPSPTPTFTPTPRRLHRFPPPKPIPPRLPRRVQQRQPIHRHRTLRRSTTHCCPGYICANIPRARKLAGSETWRS